MVNKLLFLGVLMFWQVALFSQTGDKPNVILIIYDDLNDWVNNFEGHPQTSTPNLDTIAALGTTFKNAFTSAPVCAPSRTSWLTGKNPSYTGVYNNEEFNDLNFRANFPDDKLIITLPQYLKDSAGYYTVGLNKIFHSEQHYPDYDTTTTDNCSRQLSWNEVVVTGNQGGLMGAGDDADQDIDLFEWAMVDDSFLVDMQDYTVVNEAATILNNYTTDPGAYCNKPLFMCVGFHKPHLQLYIPEQFFLPYYKENFYESPYVLPYNHPDNQFPYNGVVMPPQPPVAYSDYDSLGFVGQKLAAFGIHNEFVDLGDSLAALININDTLSFNETSDILFKSKMANAVMAYLAAVKFGDAQLGRLWDTLNMHPDILNNSIIIITSDHGYSLDEKKHWKKNTLWETDIRIPFFVIDMRATETKTSYMPVSLLDIFPTVCDYIGVDVPKNEFGTDYTDGKSIKKIIEDTTLLFESPKLTTYKAEESKQAGCFEQYSVRNERFHYLQYHSNNIEGVYDCDASASVLEEELYEIGKHRDVDPNEWNNLAYDNDYLPIKNYLSQWCTGKSMYKQITYKPVINYIHSECPVSLGDSVQFYFDLYDTTGMLTSPPANYKYVWRNNYSDEAFSGYNYTAAFTDLDVLVNLDKVMIYLTIEDTVNNITRGLDLLYIQFEGTTVPEIDFTSTIDKTTNTVYITDILYPVDKDTVYWDFGDGTFYYGEIPPPHTYTGYGKFNISCNVTYGGETTCIWREVNQVETIPFDKSETILLFPNPVGSILHFATFTIIEDAVIYITDATGKNVATFSIKNNNALIQTIDVGILATGLYHFTIATGESVNSVPFIKF